MMLIMASTYYLPLYYQASKQVSAIVAGLEILPFVVASILGQHRFFFKLFTRLT